MGWGHIPVMNLFSVCLCALLMNGALLYTTLLPLQTHLKVAKEMMAISDTEHVTYTINGAQYTQPHFIYNAWMLETCCNKTSRYKKCWGTQRWAHGLCFVWNDSHGKVGAKGAQVQKWVFILLMMWIPARPLSAHTNCLWASSHSTRHFFCRDFRSSSIVMVLGRGKINDTEWVNFK